MGRIRWQAEEIVLLDLDGIISCLLCAKFITGPEHRTRLGPCQTRKPQSEMSALMGTQRRNPGARGCWWL